MDKMITAIAYPQFPLTLGMPIFGAAQGNGGVAVEAKRVRTHLVRAAATAKATANVWGPDAWSPPV